jgi:hypothetical protein
MDWLETALKVSGLLILLIIFIGSWIEKTSVEGYEDKTGFNRGKKK